MAKEPRQISANAFNRLRALQAAQLAAVNRLTDGDDYPDFFVEGSGPPWHEMWPEVIKGAKEFSEDRMTFIDRLAQDDYPDFFVEGSGPAWHERWPEVISGQRFDASNIQHRVRALKGLNVVQSYLRMKARTKSP
jgi:hypothetical protein